MAEQDDVTLRGATTLAKHCDFSRQSVLINVQPVSLAMGQADCGFSEVITEWLLEQETVMPHSMLTSVT